MEQEKQPMMNSKKLFRTRKIKRTPESAAVFIVFLSIWTCVLGLIYHRNFMNYNPEDRKQRSQFRIPSRVVYMADTVAVQRNITERVTNTQPLESKRKEPTKECVPRTWMTTPHANCNDLHALDNMGDLLVKSADSEKRQGLVQIYTTGGTRMGGRLLLDNDDFPVIYKVLRLQTCIRFNSDRYERSRLEALIMEHQNSAVDVYSFCGISIITEFGDGGKLSEVLEGSITPIEKLEYAVNISRSVAESNSMGIVIRDVEESNIAFVRERIKFIDFDGAVPILWKENHRPCYPSNLTHADVIDTLPPEELKRDELTEKVDSYALGTVIFYLLTNVKLYHCERPRGECSKHGGLPANELRKIKKNGTLPTLPIGIEKSSDPVIQFMLDTMKQTLHLDAIQRPSTQEVSQNLYNFLKSLHDVDGEKQRDTTKTDRTNCEPRTARRANVKEPVYVASYPGSGSELTLNIIEALTGIQTLSYGGRCDAPEKPYDYVALKTHYPWSCKGHKQHGVLSRVVVLIRDPLNSLPSKASRDFENDDQANPHSKQAPQKYWIEWRNRHFKVHLALWEELVRYWIDSYAPSNRIVIPYENLISGPEPSLELARFLNSRSESVSVVDEKTIRCIWQRDVVEDKSQRRSNTRRKKTYQPEFTQDQLDELSAVISRLTTQYTNTSYGQVFAEYGQVVDERKKQLASPRIAWLMSYPNSYNTAIRNLLQVTTNTTGATNYGKERISLDGTHSFNSASVPVSSETNGPFRINTDLPLPHSGFILTKTHCGIDGCFECNVPSPERFLQECTRGYKVTRTGKQISTAYNSNKVKRAVHLFLNPFTNVILRFRGDKSCGSTREDFQNWCREYDTRFLRETKHTHLVPREVLESSLLCHTEFFKYVQWHNNAANAIRLKKVPVHVLHAEDFFGDDFQETVTQLLDFLGLERVEEGEPFSTANVLHDYFAPNEVGEVRLFIKHYASDEIWRTLHSRYLSNTSVYY